MRFNPFLNSLTTFLIILSHAITRITYLRSRNHSQYTQIQYDSTTDRHYQYHAPPSPSVVENVQPSTIWRRTTIDDTKDAVATISTPQVQAIHHITR